MLIKEKLICIPYYERNNVEAYLENSDKIYNNLLA